MLFNKDSSNNTRREPKKLEFSAKSINKNHCEKNLSDIEFKSKTLKLRVCIIQTEKKISIDVHTSFFKIPF